MPKHLTLLPQPRSQGLAGADVKLLSFGELFTGRVKPFPVGRILQGRNSVQIVCPLCKRHQPSLTSSSLVIGYDPRVVRNAIWTCEQCLKKFRLR